MDLVPAEISVEVQSAGRRYGIYMADMDRSRTRSHGIINYAVGLTNSLGAMLTDDEVLVALVNPTIAEEVDWQSIPRVRRLVLPTPTSAQSRLRLDNVTISKIGRQLRLHSLHFPKGMIPIGPRSATRIVATIHDDIPLQYLLGRFGSRAPIAQNGYIAARLYWSLVHSDAVLTDSDFSANALQRLWSRVRPVVAGVGVDTADGPLPLKALGDRDSTMLILASQLPHKATSELAEMIRSLEGVLPQFLRVSFLGSAPEGLAWLGSWSIEGPLPNAQDVTARLSRARLLVFGTKYEGFGLPPIEAWLAGTPAVFPLIEPLVSNLNGIPGGYAPGDAASLLEAIAAVLALSETDIAAVQAVLRHRFSWVRPSSTVLDVYRDEFIDAKVSSSQLWSGNRS